MGTADKLKIWLSLGWLVEGVFLTAYGIIRSNTKFKVTGFLIYSLCLLTFLNQNIRLYDDLFPACKLTIVFFVAIILH